MLVYFATKFIRLDQKQRRNGEAFRASPTCLWSSLIDLYGKLLSFFPRDVLDEILDLIESVSGGFPTYS